ncbi:MAG: AbrB/MazE/SpoVT family DNA-binding domain-containing protein [Alphaproteobacteria bacterium]|nr:AbrB/MazE/SpoVT family DNA-binding domain-containing protein [Alphaproteobacteria bacterium]MCY3754888.1 AbrB/MazE/SpoVT family DNA-binding domain-containing protein [Alphaproteobacteria bacterium]MYE03308.1 AbrB/MazE/SpoVT family DNA-binding domain-containing protein [Alphaproteobacteria bacterium]
MRVSKWGNSLAVRLPKAVVNDLGLKAGDRLEIVSANPERLAVARDERKLRAIERMRARALPIPADYAFDRDEANAR